MKVISYHIDKELSDREGCLAVRLVLAEESKGNFEFFPEITVLSLKFANEKDKDVFNLFPPAENLLKIPYPKTHAALKLLGMTGRLFFNGRSIVCDFFGKTELSYHLKIGAPIPTIEPRLQSGDRQDFLLSDCTFLCGGTPPFFIKGISLKFIAGSLSWKQLLSSYTAPQKLSIKDLEEDAAIDPEAPRAHFKDAGIVTGIESSPWPLLILQDRLGSFADLWMIYPASSSGEEEIRLPFHDTSSLVEKRGGKRQTESEKGWEKDLLESDFIKKTVGTSHYYCPLDKVSKTLSFLLEVGWQILDHRGKRVVKHSETHLTLETRPVHFFLKGSIDYESHQVSIQNVAGAFNRRERFVQLGQGTVGLLPDSPEQLGLKGIVDEGEIVGDGIAIRRNNLGCLRDLLEANQTITFDADIAPLKEKLLNFSGFTAAPPSPAFQGTLRPYQQEGVNWLAFLYDYGFHGMLADDMGLGKTVQVLAFLSRLPTDSPRLIIVPTSLMFNWRKEIEKFLPGIQATVHHGPGRIKTVEHLMQAAFIITSYATLRLDLPFFQQFTFACIILDEAQVIKNADTQTAQAVKLLQARFRLSLTGTPLENHLKELWSHFDFLMPDLLGEEKFFSADLEAATLDGRYLQRIRKKIRQFLLRRTKSEVAKDLPERIEQEVWIEMPPTQRKIYEDFLSGVRGNLLKKINVDGVSAHRMEVLEAILRLRQICCHPLLASGQADYDTPPESGKLDMLLQDMETAIEEGRKCLVYSQFTSMLALISKECRQRGWPFVYLDGSTKNREEVVRRFQEDAGIPLFLISLKAGGIGLNLTAADYVFLYDPWWNTAVENQAIDRAHRIGRRDSVIAKRYIVAESIEEKMMKLKAAKNSLVNEILDDSMTLTSLTAEDLRYLLS